MHARLRVLGWIRLELLQDIWRDEGGDALTILCRPSMPSDAGSIGWSSTGTNNSSLRRPRG